MSLSPAWNRWYATVLPSGRNCGWWITWPAGTDTSVERAEVATSTTSMRVSATTKAIRLPSGDHVGSYSSSAVSTTARITPVVVS